MRYEIEVSNPSGGGANREWTRAFGKIRNDFLAKLRERMEAHDVAEVRGFDECGKEEPLAWQICSTILRR